MLRRLAAPLAAAALAAAPLHGCSGGDEPLDGKDEPFPDGKADGGIEPGSPEARAVLDLVNDLSVDEQELDVDARLNALAAESIIAHRDGGADPFDGVDPAGEEEYESALDELDSVFFVGPFALEQLLAYAIETGRLEEGARVDVIFSPAPSQEASHNARVADLIAGAEHTIDVAMYSFGSSDIQDELEAAIERGVEVRFLSREAAEDRKIDDLGARAASESGELESAGIDVRWVNKIMHHKFVIVDGPRDQLERAGTARIASGSANWSFGGAFKYDENTLFIEESPEAALRLQREFNLLWEHSRDFALEEPLPHELSSLEITDQMIEGADDTGFDVFFTSPNYQISEGSTTFRLEDRPEQLHVAEKWVEAIESADDSIWIASGHLRLRPVAEALVAKKEANPGMDIRVYVDAQEYISEFGHQEQQDELDDCLAEAEDETDVFDCEQSGFLFSKKVSDAGIDLRYKYYSYRWHFSYAKQMHHKYMIIDGDELYTGSYNLSLNAEQDTFENVMHLSGPAYQELIDRYEDNFSTLWVTNRSGLAELEDEIENGDPVPLVFDPIALDWSEVADLKDLIEANCEQLFSDPFRTEPASHQECPRLD